MAVDYSCVMCGTCAGAADSATPWFPLLDSAGESSCGKCVAMASECAD